MIYHHMPVFIGILGFGWSWAAALYWIYGPVMLWAIYTVVIHTFGPPPDPPIEPDEDDEQDVPGEWR